MTREELIAMAREAGLKSQKHNLASSPVQYRTSYQGWEDELERFFHAAYASGAAAENEACALVCRSWADDHAKHDNCSYYNCDFVAAAQDCAEAIRARRKA